jgi:hypothetical protein
MGIYPRRATLTFLLVALSLGTATAALSQEEDSPSLGDVARQARLAKQQKDAQAGTATPGQSVSGQSKDGESGANAAQETTSKDVTTTAPLKSAASAQSKAEGSSGSNPASTVTKAGKSEKKVLTNDDIGGAHIAPASSLESKATSAQPASSASSGSTDEKNPPDYWSTRILAQKNAIASLKNDIDQLGASIQYAPGNCVEGCVEWNEHQQQKQQQVESMKAQLEEMQKQLDDMQDGARKQGYGSSVYDP